MTKIAFQGALYDQCRNDEKEAGTDSLYNNNECFRL
jgi:hypothetical protein